MDLSERVRIAVIAIDKRLDYEALYYGDEMYGRESSTESVFDLVEECAQIGRIAFNEKYGLN